MTSFKNEELAAHRVSAWGRTIAAIALVPVVLFMVPWPLHLFYFLGLFVFSILGWVAYIAARSPSSTPWHQYVIVSIDFAWWAFIALYPNPFAPDDFASFIALRTGAFLSFFILLAGLAFLYQPRLVIWGGISAAISWAGGILLLSQNTNSVTSLLFGGNLDSHLNSSVSPYFIDMSARIWEVVVFLVVALLLASAVRRARLIVLRQVDLSVERSNLARYFPPHTAEKLATNKDLFGKPSEPQAAVLFADLVGFTRWAQDKPPRETISVIQEILARLTEVVFQHNGTLDKFIGDGLMATFGTLENRTNDATNALATAVTMRQAFKSWQEDEGQKTKGHLELSIGVHFGPVVVGDVGTTDRLEIAVLGNTVNVASRLESATRRVGCHSLISKDLVTACEQENSQAGAKLMELLSHEHSISLKGVDQPCGAFELKEISSG